MVFQSTLGALRGPVLDKDGNLSREWVKKFQEWEAKLGGNLAIPSIKLTLSVRANNAAALAAGLVAGQLYRTGADPDVVCVVH
jgi:hypothetical protein